MGDLSIELASFPTDATTTTEEDPEHVGMANAPPSGGAVWVAGEGILGASGNFLTLVAGTCAGKNPHDVEKAHSIRSKRNCAIKPASGGKTSVLTTRAKVSLQPRIPISIGNLATAQSDQPVRKATMVPTPAPD